MEWKPPTPAGAVTEQSDRTIRAEDPGLSKAKEAAKAVPAESVRLERNEGSLPSFSTNSTPESILLSGVYLPFFHLFRRINQRHWIAADKCTGRYVFVDECGS